MGDNMRKFQFLENWEPYSVNSEYFYDHYHTVITLGQLIPLQKHRFHVY